MSLYYWRNGGSGQVTSGCVVSRFTCFCGEVTNQVFLPSCEQFYQCTVGSLSFDLLVQYG